MLTSGKSQSGEETGRVPRVRGVAGKQGSWLSLGIWKAGKGQGEAERSQAGEGMAPAPQEMV